MGVPITGPGRVGRRAKEGRCQALPNFWAPELFGSFFQALVSFQVYIWAPDLFTPKPAKASCWI